MPYELRVTATAEKTLDNLENATRAQLLLRFYQLVKDPRPTSAVLLDSEEETYYLAIARYRVVYWVQRSQVIVLMIVADAR